MGKEGRGAVGGGVGDCVGNGVDGGDDIVVAGEVGSAVIHFEADGGE